MDELPQIDTSVNLKPFKRAYRTAEEKQLIKIGISAAVAASVVVFIALASYWQASEQAALKTEIKGLHDSAWEGITPEDVQRWSK